jgi:hypothetical protein
VYKIVEEKLQSFLTLALRELSGQLQTQEAFLSKKLKERLLWNLSVDDNVILNGS